MTILDILKACCNVFKKKSENSVMLFLKAFHTKVKITPDLLSTKFRPTTDSLGTIDVYCAIHINS